MSERRTNMLIALCWLWVAAVAFYAGWSALGSRGLYRRLVELQIGWWGSYDPTLTAFLPGLLLAAPGFGTMARLAMDRRKREPPGPATEARRRRRLARLLAFLGLAFVLAGAGAWALALGMPDGTEPPVRFDLATLGGAPVPAGRVILAGTPDPATVTGSALTGGRGGEGSSFYVGFRPSPARAPLRLFVEHNAGDRRELRAIEAVQIGYLVENGLPPLALHDLRVRGIEVASPHYVLRTGASAPRAPYLLFAGLGWLAAFLFLTAAGIAALRARQRASA